MADLTDQELQDYIAKQFIRVGEVELVETDAPWKLHVFEFNSLLNVAGDGDFRLSIREDEAGELSIVDYEALS